MHYNHKAMRDFANRLSRELDLELSVGQSGSKKTRRYYLSEWNDIYGFSRVRISLGIYDKFQQRLNMVGAILGDDDYHLISDFDEGTRYAIRDLRRQKRTLIWFEMTVCDKRHICQNRIVAVVSHIGLLQEESFETVKEWLEDIREERDEWFEEKPHLADTLKRINRMQCDYLFYNLINDRIFIGIDGKYGLLTPYGEPLCEVKYDTLMEWDSVDYMRVSIASKWGCINSQGKEIVPVKFDYIEFFNKKGCYAKARLNGKYGIIDQTGNFVVEPTYDDIGGVYYAPNIEENVFTAKCGKWGVVNFFGDMIIPFAYDELGAYQEGCIPARKNNKWGFITLEDKIAIPFEYDYANAFSNGGVTYVRVGDEWFYIDKDGNRVECEEDDDDLPF